ncbi:MAG: glycosyltransferase family 2 protein [Cetobacterium sp.]
MKSPLVSVIMPAYNAERFIKESIESVISQSYKNWELLIINDFSNDLTQLIIKDYCKKDKRVKLLEQEENKGVVKARNRGIKESKGKYIAFLDSDDLWENDKLEIQIKYMQDNEVYMTYTGYSYISENGDFIKEICVPKSLNYKQALKGNQIGCLTVIIDKSKIGNFEMPNLKHEDYATWLNILKNNTVAYGILENLAKYRKVNNSLSSNKLKTIGWTWNILKNNQKLNSIVSLYYLLCHIKQALKKHSFK